LYFFVFNTYFTSARYEKDLQFLCKHLPVSRRGGEIVGPSFDATVQVDYPANE